MKMKRFLVALTAFLFFVTAFQNCKKQAFTAEEDAVIQLIADTLNIQLNESVRITIRGYNSDGSYLWDGTRIDLTIENGSLNTTSVETDNGEAYVTATANMERGEMKIKARSGNSIADPNPLVITVGALPTVNRIVASMYPASLPYEGGRLEIVVTVYDEYMLPISGINVALEASAGTLDSRGAPLTTNYWGQVIDYLTTETDATVTIYAGEESSSLDITLGEEPTPNTQPYAYFSYSPNSPVSKETIYFNANSSTDDDGEIVKYQWDFGDGSYTNGKTPTHSYDIYPWTSKTFNVTLTVWDDDGAHDATTQSITVVMKDD